jgi:nucleotide-binding universal stress UspA family protein
LCVIQEYIIQIREIIMNTFSVKFKAGSLDLSAIVTVSDHHQRFKVEMITGEPNPILLRRSATGNWTIENPGSRALSAEQFLELEKAIDQYIVKLYGGKKILVLTDFSDAAFNAAVYAAALTRQLKSSVLILYHSHEYLPVVTTTYAPVSPEMVHSEKNSYEKLSSLKEKLETLVDENTVIELIADARPLAAAVNTLTVQQQISLVVMGIAGKNALEKTLVGSNTITVAKENNVPLLVVPGKAEFRTIRNVVFACDLKNVSKTIPATQIHTFIDAIHAQLSILYVNKVDKKTDPAARNELNALHQIWDEQKVEYHYTDHENIEEGILDFADEKTMDLLIAVPKEYGFFERIFHRSLTNNLVYRTHIPLLVFKEDL